MSKIRIYTVTDTETAAKRLVRAANRSQAISHCAQRFGADVASQEELVRLLDDGVVVETAGAEAQS